MVTPLIKGEGEGVRGVGECEDVQPWQKNSGTLENVCAKFFTSFQLNFVCIW